MISKLRIFSADLKERGVAYSFKRLVIFVFRPITNLVKRNRALTEFFYGIFPKLILFPASSGLIKFEQTELVQAVREFWYKNTPGDFDLDGEKITRRDIFTYGGPNQKLSCSICQKSEWLSRARQRNLFIPHSCRQARGCEILCARQGDELWTHFHQNFNFSFGCDPDLPAPRCLYVDQKPERNFLNPHCDTWAALTLRRLSYSCQVDIVKRPAKINWQNYDFLFTVNGGSNFKFPRPPIPVVLYGHDFWPLENKNFQWMIDWIKPDIFLSACIGPWRENYKFPYHTKLVFYPFFDSLFFARPNLGKKERDLLVIGAKTSSAMYGQRIVLNKQISKLTDQYWIEFSQLDGAGNVFREGPVFRQDARSGANIRFLNKWSEYLGLSNFVIFGRMKYPVLVAKYYEVLGSGAIPVFPEVPDFKYLGIKPFEHYIPLSEVEGNNRKLAYFLDNYEKYKGIAKNAVNWYKENSDRMIFNDFENMVRDITGYHFPKRLI